MYLTDHVTTTEIIADITMPNRLAVLLSIAAICSMAISSCSSTPKTESPQEFMVEYYTVGGFAGTSDGYTLTSDGLVRFWEGPSLDTRKVIDSLHLSEDQLRPIAEMIGRDDLYAVKQGEAQNMTTVISVHCGARSMTTMFSPPMLPEGATDSFRSLLTELQKIHR